MNKKIMYHHPNQTDFNFTYDHYLKLMYLNFIQDEYLFNRLSLLLKKLDLSLHINRYLIEFYLIGKTSVYLSKEEKLLIDLLEEYFELYLYHGINEYQNFIIGEITYNSLYNPLIETNEEKIKKTHL